MRKRLQQRAALWQFIRDFFAARNVLEVNTLILNPGGNPDPHLGNVRTMDGAYLHTSPEFAMKALLSQGSGDIYQICHVFRQDERGRHHRPEFLMLEWYRCGWNHQDLMAEVAALIGACLPQYRDRSPQICDYRALFLQYLNVDIDAPTEALRQRSEALLGHDLDLDRDGYLDVMFSHAIQPHLGMEVPVFVVHYPVSQAALARIIEHEGQPVAARFELFIQGLELCNGFWELTDWNEQQQRFAAENQRRSASGLPEIEPDPILLSALRRGLPDCAGVALGLERLLMLQLQCQDIQEVAMEV